MIHPWVLNTLRNVKTLEKHVGQEIYDYIQDSEDSEDDFTKEKFEENIEYLMEPSNLANFQKVRNL